jgi:hypothetical protein
MKTMKEAIREQQADSQKKIVIRRAVVSDAAQIMKMMKEISEEPLIYDPLFK